MSVVKNREWRGLQSAQAGMNARKVDVQTFQLTLLLEVHESHSHRHASGGEELNAIHIRSKVLGR